METKPIFKAADASGKEELIAIVPTDGSADAEVKERAEAIVADTPLAEGAAAMIVEAPKARVLLADQVTNMLREKGHPDPEAWKDTPITTLHPDHATVSEPKQRFLINRQLRIILGNTTLDTINKRTVLNDDAKLPTQSWLGIMERSIVPFFVQHNLPLKD